MINHTKGHLPLFALIQDGQHHFNHVIMNPTFNKDNKKLLISLF